MSFGLNQTVEAKQLVVEEYITAGDYAGESYNKDLIIRAGDVEHAQNIKFSLFSNGELNDVAKITSRGLETEKILSNELYTQDNISALGGLKISHDSDSGEYGYCGQLTVNLNCGLSSGDAFVEALRVTSDCLEANGSIHSLSLDSDVVNSKELRVCSTPDHSIVAEFKHPHCSNNITIHELDDMLTLSGNIIAGTLSASDVYLESAVIDDFISNKVNTENLRVGSWDIRPSESGLKLEGPGEVSLHTIDCVEVTSEIVTDPTLRLLQLKLIHVQSHSPLATHS